MRCPVSGLLPSELASCKDGKSKDASNLAIGNSIRQLLLVPAPCLSPPPLAPRLPGPWCRWNYHIHEPGESSVDSNGMHLSFVVLSMRIRHFVVSVLSLIVKNKAAMWRADGPYLLERQRWKRQDGLQQPRSAQRTATYGGP